MVFRVESFPGGHWRGRGAVISATKGDRDGCGGQDPERQRGSAGKVKETTGRATGNQSLEAEGRADQASANVKQAGEKAKDAVKDALD